MLRHIVIGLLLTLGAVVFTGSVTAQTAPRDRDPDDDDPSRPVIVQAPSDVALSSSGRPEFVILGPSAEVANIIQRLTEDGGVTIRQRVLPELAWEILTVSFRRGENLRSLRRSLESIAPNSLIDENHLYSFAQQSPRLYAPEMVGLQDVGACPPVSGLRIGIIDGPVDASHPALVGANITQQSTLSSDDQVVHGNHGTAVAALLVGTDTAGALSGYLQGARLYSAHAFADENGEPAADVSRIATALDWLAAADVLAINMSFAGPENIVLERLLADVADRNIIMVAAAGNTGRRENLLPAASPDVIAVTAIDAARRVYRSASYGNHIEFAAPGVDVYVANGGGGGYASGTSFAAPIITAFAARSLQASHQDIESLRNALRAQSQDLGDAGRDQRYGWGLVRAADC